MWNTRAFVLWSYNVMAWFLDWWESLCPSPSCHVLQRSGPAQGYCWSKSSAVHHLQGAESNRVVLQHHLPLLKVPRSHQHPALTLGKRLGMFIVQSNYRELCILKRKAYQHRTRKNKLRCSAEVLTLPILHSPCEGIWIFGSWVHWSFLKKRIKMYKFVS